jgi:hypothetical protein
VAGQTGFELRNVAAKYPFERSRRFPGTLAEFWPRDYSRLNCSSLPEVYQLFERRSRHTMGNPRQLTYPYQIGAAAELVRVSNRRLKGPMFIEELT